MESNPEIDEDADKSGDDFAIPDVSQETENGDDNDSMVSAIDDSGEQGEEVAIGDDTEQPKDEDNLANDELQGNIDSQENDGSQDNGELQEEDDVQDDTDVNEEDDSQDDDDDGDGQVQEPDQKRARIADDTQAINGSNEEKNNKADASQGNQGTMGPLPNHPQPSAPPLPPATPGGTPMTMMPQGMPYAPMSFPPMMMMSPYMYGFNPYYSTAAYPPNMAGNSKKNGENGEPQTPMSPNMMMMNPAMNPAAHTMMYNPYMMQNFQGMFNNPFYSRPEQPPMFSPTYPMNLKKGISLALSVDAEMLSEYQLLVRKQLELFEAGPEDVESNTQGRKKQVAVGQVGLRCRHCAPFPLRARGRGAVYYPAKLSGMLQSQLVCCYALHCFALAFVLFCVFLIKSSYVARHLPSGPKYGWESPLPIVSANSHAN